MKPCQMNRHGPRAATKKSAIYLYRLIQIGVKISRRYGPRVATKKSAGYLNQKSRKKVAPVMNFSPGVLKLSPLIR